MSNNLTLEGQIAALEKLVDQTPVSAGDRLVWNTSRARAGFKAKHVFPPLPSIPISDKDARAKVLLRQEHYSRHVAARFIPELLVLLKKTQVAKVKTSILGRLRFLRIEHLKLCRRYPSTPKVPELSDIELAEFPKDVVSVLKSFRSLYPPKESVPVSAPILNKPSDISNPCCFSYTKQIESPSELPRPQATITRHNQGKRKSIRTKRFDYRACSYLVA